jgi:TnpA family transposase
VLIEVDGLIRFSWVLLGRPARSEPELVTLYAALLVLGSDLSVSDLARIAPAVQADSVGQMVARIEAEDRLRAVNDAVLRCLPGHRVAGLWGRGLFASADMMSLEATRYLWSARLDPRRRTYAVGTYAHVLDQWGILYDQPIVLNRRQVGAAIDGALRQQQVERRERVAVDTHGFTHFGMTLAKMAGFDLCPRLARLKKRRLYLPKGLDVPEILRPIVAATVSRRKAGLGWDGLLRLVASVKHGWYPATEALDRFASAAPATPSTRPTRRWGNCCARCISATISPTRYSATKSSQEAPCSSLANGGRQGRTRRDIHNTIRRSSRSVRGMLGNWLVPSAR